MSETYLPDGHTPTSPQQPAAAIPQQVAVAPHLSDDGRWLWTGVEWIPAPPTSPVARPAADTSPNPTAPTAAGLPGPIRPIGPPPTAAPRDASAPGRRGGRRRVLIAAAVLAVVGAGIAVPLTVLHGHHHTAVSDDSTGAAPAVDPTVQQHQTCVSELDNATVDIHNNGNAGLTNEIGVGGMGDPFLAEAERISGEYYSWFYQDGQAKARQLTANAEDSWCTANGNPDRNSEQ